MTTTSKPAFNKTDAGKPMMGCLPPNALLATARVLTFGAAKYGRENWHKVEAWSRYYDALQRHLTMWWAGEDTDPDTGESHLAHACCCLMFLQELESLGKSTDDRPALAKNPGGV